MQTGVLLAAMAASAGVSALLSRSFLRGYASGRHDIALFSMLGLIAVMVVAIISATALVMTLSGRAAP